MNYTFYIITLVSFLIVIGLPIWIKRRLQLIFFTKETIRKTLNNQPCFFSSYIIAEAVKIVIKHRQKKSLEALLNGKPEKAAKSIIAYDKITAIMLNATKSPQKACLQLEKYVKQNPQNQLACAYLALLYSAMNDKKYQTAWDNVSEKKLPNYFKAQYNINIAERALKYGDLELASQSFYRAANLFGKSYFEKANVYIKLGTTYRICFVYDVAESLFRSALDIFKQIKNSYGKIYALANLGMLMVGQERFSEAENYYQKALFEAKLSNNLIAIAEIKNQQALMLLLMKKHIEAEKLSKQAFLIHRQNNDENGMGFSLELQANNAWAQHKYTKTIRLAKKATDLYIKQQNISAMLECMYLQAQALLKKDNDIASEKILRKIIEEGKKDCGCFYLANAYTLLGIIFVKRCDLRRAKGLFQQSLDLEQRGVRLNAIAADYANIGIIDMRCGNKENAKKNLQTALEFALQADDKELCDTLRQHLEKLII